MQSPTLRHAVLVLGLALVLLPCSAVAAPPASEMANLRAAREAAQVAFSRKLDAHLARRTSAMFERQVRILADARQSPVQPVASPANAAPADDPPSSLSCTVSPRVPLVCDVDSARPASPHSDRVARD